MKRVVFTLMIGFVAWSAGTVGEARAQAAGCNEVMPLLEERQGLVERLNKLGNDNVDPRPACRIFRTLQDNGDKVSAFLDENQAWCQIPQDFVDGFRADHTRVGELRTQACRAAAQVDRLERQAREQQQRGNAFGGPGLTGQFPMPRGAL